VGPDHLFPMELAEAVGPSTRRRSTSSPTTAAANLLTALLGKGKNHGRHIESG